MSANGLLQLILYFLVLLLLVKPLGVYMARVFEGKGVWLSRVLGPVERLNYRLCGVKADQEMTWKSYALAMLLFNFAGFVVVYALQRLQHLLPLNPAAMGIVSPDSSFNTAVSFITNTNWQGYGGETTMSYLTQMAGLAVQNFVSAAAGIVIAVALIRGLARRSAQTIGSFWVDMTRTTLYILLPLSIVLAVALVSQGVVQSLGPYKNVKLLQPVTYDAPKLDKDGNPLKDDKGNPLTEKKTVTEQTLALGPVASQEVIKELGTNGGGFFNANSAHPFENPSPLSNFLEMLAILLIPGALCHTFGHMVGDQRQGWAVLAAMVILLVGFLAVCAVSEQRGNPALTRLGLDQTVRETKPQTAQSGGNMEGKEVRFGIVNSALFATATTGTSCGAVNSMHDSYTPLGGMVPMVLIELGEVVFGGVGAGLYGMLLFAIVAVFIAGLMVGRTPEYLGKKIEAYDMKMASLGILIPCAVVLLGTAVAVLSPGGQFNVDGTSRLANTGPHGFSEILYAYSSATNNNGSAFAGISANNPFYNVSLAIVMLMGRYWVKIVVLAVAGSLAAKKYVPIGGGTLPTHTPLFVVLIISVVLIVGALTFIPALALGPIIEHLMLAAP